MKKKFYVVWEGREPGIYETWLECEKQVKGFQGAKFKSFDDYELAKIAFLNSPNKLFEKENQKLVNYEVLKMPPILESICVDGAHSFGNHLSEYQGVYTKTGERLFYKGPFQKGSNNIMEFLAIVHALALCKKKSWNFPIYSDSQTAINWVKEKKIHTTIQKNCENQEIFNLLKKALEWLHTHSYENLILKWDTKNWGENPADFHRK